MKALDNGGSQMVRLRVLDLLESKGRTKYWLFMQLGGTGYQNFKKMVNNETRSISYKRIQELCDILECTPNDLFEITNEK